MANRDRKLARKWKLVEFLEKIQTYNPVDREERKGSLSIDDE